jgi:hypothetical protein
MPIWDHMDCADLTFTAVATKLQEMGTSSSVQRQQRYVRTPKVLINLRGFNADNAS